MATVLVTGAAAGIGRATAQLFAANGWRCVLLDRDSEGLDRVIRQLPHPEQGEHLLCKVDLTNEEEIRSLAFMDVSINVLINNAGMTSNDGRLLVEQRWDNLKPVLDLNLEAPRLIIESLESCLTPDCNIIHVASGAGLKAIPNRGLYSASKAGLIALATAQARIWSQRSIHVLCPGFIKTELVDGLIQSGRLDPTSAVSKIPVGYMGTPEDIAFGLYFLSAAETRALSSMPLIIDGGSSVYGGSQPANTDLKDPVPLTAPCLYEVINAALPSIGNAAIISDSRASNQYHAVIDFTPAASAPEALLAAIHNAAQRFAKNTVAPASLTIVSPYYNDELSEIDGAVQAASKMLISTLACELGPLGYRINAVAMKPGCSQASQIHILRYLGGTSARYISGQVLYLNE